MTVYPLVLQLGALEVTGFGIMIMVGFLVGAWLVGLELKRHGWNPDYTANIVAAGIVGGLIGGKLWYVAVTGDTAAFLSRTGFVWYGSLIGGAIAVLLNGVRLDVPTRVTMHLVAPALAAAYAVGRVGCFLVGDDYGLPTALPWAVKFPQGIPPSTAANLASQFGVDLTAGSSPAAVLAVHPTQLYEVVIMLGAFMVLWRWRAAKRPLGWLFGAYLVLAGTERFLVEILRAKDDRFLGPFTVAQLVSGLLVVGGVIIMARIGRRPEPAPGPYLVAEPAA